MKLKFDRRLAIAFAVGVLANSVQAETFPSRAITVIAPFAAGGSADGIARVVAQEMGQVLGQPVIVDNKPGAGGATGLLLLAKANTDGYTIGMGATGAIVIGPHLPDAPPLNPEKQLLPLAKVADIPLVVVASSKSGYNDLKSLIDAGKANELPIGNSGQYTAHHLASEMLANTTKMKISPVPYRGSSPAIMDVVGGQLPAAVVDLTAAAGHIKSGTVKALAVTSENRFKFAPEIPTISEAGLPGFAAPAWMGMFAPKGINKEASEKLSKAIQVALDKPDVQNRIRSLSADPSYLASQPFANFIDVEDKRWANALAKLPKQK